MQFDMLGVQKVEEGGGHSALRSSCTNGQGGGGGLSQFYTISSVSQEVVYPQTEGLTHRELAKFGEESWHNCVKG